MLYKKENINSWITFDHPISSIAVIFPTEDSERLKIHPISIYSFKIENNKLFGKGLVGDFDYPHYIFLWELPTYFESTVNNIEKFIREHRTSYIEIYLTENTFEYPSKEIPIIPIQKK